mgnify:CR=1 FL=1
MPTQTYNMALFPRPFCSSLYFRNVLLLYDENSLKYPNFPHQDYKQFNLERLDDSKCLANFRFHASLTNKAKLGDITWNRTS